MARMANIEHQPPGQQYKGRTFEVCCSPLSLPHHSPLPNPSRIPLVRTLTDPSARLHHHDIKVHPIMIPLVLNKLAYKTRCWTDAVHFALIDNWGADRARQPPLGSSCQPCQPPRQIHTKQVPFANTPATSPLVQPILRRFVAFLIAKAEIPPSKTATQPTLYVLNEPSFCLGFS